MLIERARETGLPDGRCDRGDHTRQRPPHAPERVTRLCDRTHCVRLALRRHNVGHASNRLALAVSLPWPPQRRSRSRISRRASSCRRSSSPRRRKRRTSRRCRPASPRSPPQTIADSGLRAITDAAIFAPNTVFTEFTARKVSNARFRGIGSSPANPAITTYLDGVPQLNSNSSNIELLDVGQIEFVRGPQSPLFGRNTLGGIVNVTTARPSMSAWTGSAIAPFGNAGLWEARGNVSGPIGDKAAIGFAAGKQQRDGYTENSITGNDLDSRDGTFAKAQALFLPNANWEARVDLRATSAIATATTRSAIWTPSASTPFRVAARLTRASPTATSTTPPSTSAAPARTSRSRARPASSRGRPRTTPISTTRRCRWRRARTWRRARSSRSRSASRRRTTRRSRSARRWSSGRPASSTSTRPTTRTR